MGVLRQGDRGVAVRALQSLLNAKLTPSPDLRPDGHFGARTADAVSRFQKLRGLAEAGVVGPVTWEALGLRAPVVPAATHTRDLKAWLPIAKAEIGIRENAKPGEHTQRIIEYHKTTMYKGTTDETPWCSSFVNWVMIQAGYRGTNSAAAKSWLNWGKPLDAPREGAITVIKKKGGTGDAATGSTSGYHVAFYLASTATHVRLLGGNQRDQVKESNYALAEYDVKGYRWPAESPPT
jgi:uncharacterized protein (TIGR02594 family)